MTPSRYHKQMLFAPIGREGQERLNQSTVVVAGCGALGCVLADSMVRAGVGTVRLLDRDFVEFGNLHRQSLFDEQDVTDALPKAIAAARRLGRVNSEVRIEPHVVDLDYRNVEQYVQGADLILDGTDNFEIRYLLNDVSLQYQIPWIFTGCTGSHGQVMPVLPGRTGCLRCLIPAPPPPGTTETCDTAGVLGPAIGVASSLQAAIALKILSGHADEVTARLHLIDVWAATFRQIDVSAMRDSGQCPACHHGERLWLRGTLKAESTVLCGRNAVQVNPPERLQLSLAELAQRLRQSGPVVENAFLVRLQIENSEGVALEFTVFPDGRAIIRGTSDPTIARSLYARYVGS